MMWIPFILQLLSQTSCHNAQGFQSLSTVEIRLGNTVRTTICTRSTSMDIFFPKRRKSGNPVVYINDVTGEYEIPMNPDVPIPSRYAIRGFVKKEFTSYHEHRAFCSRFGLVNHRDEDVRNDEDILRRSESKDSLGN